MCVAGREFVFGGLVELFVDDLVLCKYLVCFKPPAVTAVHP